jgi:lipopolysaccharide/colanic/teichoic acid biosynthesis glycosyltransferase
MNPPPDAFGSAVFAIGDNLAPVARADFEMVGGPLPVGLAHVVPVPTHEPVGTSGQLTEALYVGFEKLAAAIGLIVTAPIMLVVAVLIRLDSPGPVLFFHTRPGRSIKCRGRDIEVRTDLRPPPGGYDPDALYYVPSYFQLVKFRTMFADARTRFPKFYAYDFAPGEFHRQPATYQRDPRVTRVGRLMRKLSLDELPNLWCVLRGDMRLVGPRPEAPQVLRYYTPEEMYKFACKPGITGLAQINGRGLLNWGQILSWDIKYIRERTVWLDLKIMLLTIKYVATRRGAF